MITWLLTILSLTGNWMNCRKIRSCFLLWIGCNIGWLAYDLAHGVISRAVLDSVQIGFSVFGFIEWGKI